jgi:hypothetical protein
MAIVKLWILKSCDDIKMFNIPFMSDKKKKKEQGSFEVVLALLQKHMYHYSQLHFLNP